MPNNASLNQFKQKYRSRYYVNRVQAPLDLSPRDNAVSFVNNFLNVTGTKSDTEEPSFSRPSPFAGDLRQQKEAQHSTKKTCVRGTPQRSQGGGNSVTNSRQTTTLKAIKKNESQPDVSKQSLFSDDSDEFDNDDENVVAKLIEKSLTEKDDILNNSKKPRENLYSSDTSVVQKPPSPVPSIHAKKWLNFKDSTFAVNNVFKNKVSKTSEDVTPNAEHLKQPEALDEVLCANITNDLHETFPDHGPADEFVLENSSSCNFDDLLSPDKKKKTSSSSPEKDQAPVPKKSNKAPGSLPKKSRNVKAPLISSTAAERLSDKFVLEEESRRNLDDWVSPLENINTSFLPTRPKNNERTPTPQKTKSNEASSSLQKKSENLIIALISNPPVERLTDEFVLEERSSNLNDWVSPLKKKKAFSSEPEKEEPELTPKKAKLSEAPNSFQKESENMTGALIRSTAAERSENEFVIVDGSSSDLNDWVSPPKKNEASSSSRPEKDAQASTPKEKTTFVEAYSGLQKESETVKESVIRRIMAKSKREKKIHVQIQPKEGVERDSDHTDDENNKDNDAQHLQQCRRSSRKRTPYDPKKFFKDMEATLTLKRTGAHNRKLSSTDEKTKDSKEPEEEQEHPVTEKKSETQKSKQRKSSKSENTLDSAKNYESNDPEATTKHAGEPVKADVKEIVETETLENGGLLSKSSDEFVIESESSSNLNNWFSPPKKKKASSSSTRPEKDEKASTPRAQNRKQKASNKKTKDSKEPEEKQEQHPVTEKKSETLKSNKQRKSSKSENRVGSAKNYESNDPDAEATTTKRASRVKNHTGEPVKADVQKIVETTVCRRPNKRLDDDGPETLENMGHLPKSSDEFVIESESSSNLNNWFSPPKKKKASSSSTRPEKDEKASTPRAQNRKQKASNKKTKDSKEPEEKQEQHPVTEKKSETLKSNKQRKSSKSENRVGSAKNYESNDPDAEATTTKRASRVKNHTGEPVKADVQKIVETTVCRRPNKRLDDDGPETLENMGHLPKKKAKSMNSISLHPADHNKNDSVFQSGPVQRQRAVKFSGPVEPIACQLDLSGEEEEVYNDGSEQEEHCSGPEEEVNMGGSKKKKHISERMEEEFERCSLVCDPITGCDTLMECIARIKESKVNEDECCSRWISFNNEIFASGKIVIYPKKMNEQGIFQSQVMLYHVENGPVLLKLHKSKSILEAGDSFFVPPGNNCFITNLQDNVAVLAFTCLKVLPPITPLTFVDRLRLFSIDRQFKKL
ncbi:nucleolar protein dao-5-like isoform X2 [Dendropsophus ebraccatus]|uniref:nucleolar protein dao-5-like isoform X2 n=1 Tax=Dendropsophus ebraccatus TaxID=150705 RepID=UPI00383228F7